MIENIKAKIDLCLKDFLKKIKREYQLHLVSPILFKSIADFTLREGKRIRPLLFILSYHGYRKSTRPIPKNLYNAAICTELLHNFMLIHDDIIDRSDLRRGKPTMHRLLKKAAANNNGNKLGYDLSIVVGDIIYALAIDAFLTIDEKPAQKEQALKYFIQTAAFTAMGEFIDIIHGVERISKIKERDVFLNYTLKTAKYTFECPLVVGAMLAGANQRNIQTLSQIGILIGQAFQIQDDILGIFGSQKNIGKSILSDIAESKKTILVCHAYRQLKGKKRSMFLHYFSKDRKSYGDLVAIRKIFINSGSLQYSLKKIELLLDKSRELVRQLDIKDRYRRTIWQSFSLLFKYSAAIAKENNLSEKIYGV